MNPRKPTHLKIIQGTFRRDRSPKNEPRPQITIPPVPDHLSSLAKEEWQRISVQLAALGLLSEIDRTALAAYCECYSDWVEASRMCATRDGQDRKVIKTPEGRFSINPYFKVKFRSAELMHKFLIEFGMTPASRSGLNASPMPSGTPTNPFARIHGEDGA